MDSDPEELIGRVQELQEELADVADHHTRERAEALVGAVIDLYGEGMKRIIGLMEEAGDSAASLRAGMADDGVIASLLLIHDLYPVPLADRVGEALDQVRPYLDSHGGGVELLSVDDGVARIRLEGSCKTCPASSATLELAVKQALDEAAPDLEGLVVEGIQESAPEATGFELPVMQVQADGSQAQQSKAAAAQSAFNVSGGAAWHELVDAGAVAEGMLRAASVHGAQIVVARVDDTLLAFRDVCPACGDAIASGTLLGGVLGCPHCAKRFDLPKAGLAVDDGGGQLEPVPLLAGGNGIRVALGA